MQAVFHGRRLGVFPTPHAAARRADVAALLYFGRDTAAAAAGVLNWAPKQPPVAPAVAASAGAGGESAREGAAAAADGWDVAPAPAATPAPAAAAPAAASTPAAATTALDVLEARLAAIFSARRRQLRRESAGAGGGASTAVGDADDATQPLGPTTFVGVHQREVDDGLRLVYDAVLGDGERGPCVGTFDDAVAAARAVDAAVVRALGADRARAAGLLNLP